MATKTKSAPVIDRAITTTTVEKKSIVCTVGHQDYIKLSRSKKDGMAILKFSAAENDRSNPDAECTWHNIVMFGQEAVEAHDAIGQGDLIRVVGSLKASEYTSVKTGLSDVYFSLSTYSLKVIEKASSEPKAQFAEVEVVTADDIPF